MKWSLLELKKYQDQPLEFSRSLDLKQAVKERDHQIIDIENVAVSGFITVAKGEYILHYDLSSVITVPSTRSLVPVSLPLDFSVDEVFMTPAQYENRTEGTADEDIIVLDADTIDLQKSIEDNILLAIPTRILSDEEKKTDELPKGEGWEVISEEEYQQRESAEQKADPRLAKLSELFSDKTGDQPDDQ